MRPEGNRPVIDIPLVKAGFSVVPLLMPLVIDATLIGLGGWAFRRRDLTM